LKQINSHEWFLLVFYVPIYPFRTIKRIFITRESTSWFLLIHLRKQFSMKEFLRHFKVDIVA